MDIAGSSKAVINIVGTKKLDLSTPSETFAPTDDVSISWANGQAVNQAEKIWHDQRTLVDDASDDLELTHAGVETDLLDAFGDEVVFTSIKAIYIYNNPGSGSASLIVGGAAVNEWLGFLTGAGDKITIGPGGHLYATNPSAAGWTVAAGARLLLTHDGAGTEDLIYDIMLLGTE